MRARALRVAISRRLMGRSSVTFSILCISRGVGHNSSSSARWRSGWGCRRERGNTANTWETIVIKHSHELERGLVPISGSSKSIMNTLSGIPVLWQLNVTAASTRRTTCNLWYLHATAQQRAQAPGQRRWSRLGRRRHVFLATVKEQVHYCMYWHVLLLALLEELTGKYPFVSQSFGRIQASVVFVRRVKSHLLIARESDGSVAEIWRDDKLRGDRWRRLVRGAYIWKNARLTLSSFRPTM